MDFVPEKNIYLWNDFPCDFFLATFVCSRSCSSTAPDVFPDSSGEQVNPIVGLTFSLIFSIGLLFSLVCGKRIETELKYIQQTLDTLYA